MITRICIVATVCLVWASPAAFADTGEVDGAHEVAESDLSESLETLIDQAVDGGLLTPSEEIHSEAFEAAQAIASSHDDGSELCASHSVLDFSAFSDVQSYSDLEPYHAKANDPATSLDDAHKVELAKAYLSLGLVAEARVLVNRISGPAPGKLVDLIELLSGASGPVFQPGEGCGPAGQFWSAAARTARDDANGAALLSQSVPVFRDLPHHLRAEVAVMVVPALDHMGDQTLALKLLSTFSKDEIAQDERLQFIRALAASRSSSGDAEAALREFAMNPQFTTDVIAAYGRSGDELPALEKSILLADLTDFFDAARTPRDIAVRLTFALSELSGMSNYEMVRSLAAHPVLQSPQAQDEIGRTMIAGLRGDFEGSDPAVQIRAFRGLLTHADFIAGRSGADALLYDASERASQLGYSGLAAELARRGGAVSRSSEHAGELAARKGDEDTLYDLADAHPTSDRLAFLSALSAVRSGDAGRLAKYEGRFAEQPGAALDLIEQDAMHRRWIVSEKLYDAAGRLEAPELQARAQRARHLRAQASGISGHTSGQKLQMVPARLSAARQAIGQLTKEIN